MYDSVHFCASHKVPGLSHFRINGYVAFLLRVKYLKFYKYSIINTYNIASFYQLSLENLIFNDKKAHNMALLPFTFWSKVTFVFSLLHIQLVPVQMWNMLVKPYIERHLKHQIHVYQKYNIILLL
jgi:hypothetical protein